MPKSRLAEKRVLITAGAQGIGDAITRHFIEAGAHVAVHYFSGRERAAELVGMAHQAGLKATAVQADLTDPSSAEAAVTGAVEALGGLDILINNAGSLVGRKRLDELDVDFWDHVMRLNVTSMMSVTRAAEPHLSRNPASAIVNLASLAGRKGGHAGSLAYSTAKGAVLTFTRALALELGPKGVRVNAVTPGLILGTSFHNTHTTKESADQTIAGIPIARAGNADDVARAVVYLASEYDGFITGATLDINGGVYSA
ncbi:MAG: SDR family NAD(P)-dependent oxidoreductase [Opitutaceae bacterium]